jgi:predicted transcriptional regulator
MNVMDQINWAIDQEKYAIINVSIYDNQNVMIDSYDIWLDNDVTLFCLQKLYVHDGRIDEIGETIACNKSELERNLLTLCQRGIIKIDVTS